jgi:hypothetical protein
MILNQDYNFLFYNILIIHKIFAINNSYSEEAFRADAILSFIFKYDHQRGKYVKEVYRSKPSLKQL